MHEKMEQGINPHDLTVAQAFRPDFAKRVPQSEMLPPASRHDLVSFFKKPATEAELLRPSILLASFSVSVLIIRECTVNLGA